MQTTLETIKAYLAGAIPSTAGLFRGEVAEIIGTSENFATVKLPNSLQPEQTYIVPKNCLSIFGG